MFNFSLMGIVVLSVTQNDIFFQFKLRLGKSRNRLMQRILRLSSLQLHTEGSIPGPAKAELSHMEQHNWLVTLRPMEGPHT